MGTYSMFYVGLINSYQNPAQSNAEALAPEWRPQALDRPEARPATDSEHRVQRSPSPTMPSVPPSQEVTHSSAQWLEAVPTGMRPQRDAQQSPSRNEPHPQVLEKHHESPNGDRPIRQRPPLSLLDDNGGIHYHVERLVGQRRRQSQSQYLVKWRGYPQLQELVVVRIATLARLFRRRGGL
ncbi:Chromo domain/shadow [Plasmopara halstedii]|uniref:Chromo domain/shadow n=1 Tax=Plasmopara halstedii TaxID=4781 RepID=A0A0P1AP84_PLAHL|nr:Chromo domain/shadow [Plasmopara halstedii]CEG43040.1 Chromo domain/shadow [Plasmopara halstedii]|eukprot:XP_024579409.1 Chromo domain/shadow [Plasmopara halstedii]